MPSFEIGLSSPAWVIVPALLIAFTAAALSYRRTLPPVPRALRITLTALRGTALALLLLLLFEPVVRAVRVSARPPVLAVLVDNSSSMRLRDAGGPRDSILQRCLTALPDILPSGTEVSVRTFGSAVSPARPDLPDTLRFDEPSTDIALALQTAGHDPGRTRAVLLMSDGNATAGPNPLYTAEDLHLPVYALGIGDSSEQRDLLVTAVSANRIMLAGTPAPVEVRVKSAGFGGERVMVTLTDGERELARTDLLLRGGVTEYTVPLTFTPRGEGGRLFTVRLSTLPGELTTDNNRRSFPATILKERLLVLILSGAPGPDEAIMRQTFREDPHLRVESFTQRPDGGYFEGEPKAPLLDSCDCLVLLGYPSASARQESVRRIADVAQRRRVPVLFVAGRALDHGMLRMFGDLLPFTIGEEHGTEQSVFAVPAEEHRDSPLLTPDSTISFSSWAALPPLFRSSTTYLPKPGAMVLATTRLQSVRLPDPLLIARATGGPRVIAILGYGLWRWRLMAQGNPEIASFYGAFLSTAVRWLTARDDARPVRIAPLQPVVTALEPLEFEGQVRDGAARPVDNAEVTVMLTGEHYSGGITLAPSGSGRYAGAFPPLPEGRYGYRGRAVISGTPVGVDSGTVSVGRLDLETFETRMSAQSLRLLADRTGGAFLLPADLASLGDALKRQPSFVPVETVTASTVEFRHWPWFCALMVLALAAEWFLRKRSGML